MTKKELIEIIADLPDDYQIWVWQSFVNKDPGGAYEFSSYEKLDQQKAILFMLEDD